MTTKRIYKTRHRISISPELFEALAEESKRKRFLAPHYFINHILSSYLEKESEKN